MYCIVGHQVDHQYDNVLKQVQRDLRAIYKRKYRYIRPLPLWEGYKFEIADMFTQLVVIPVKHKDAIGKKGYING